MHLKQHLTIPPPEFEMFAPVWLQMDNKRTATQIISRWYNLDNEVWFYVVINQEGLYPADVLLRDTTPFSA